MFAVTGSSPLTRGKRRRPRVRRVQRRLIPAHAGKTSYQRVPWCSGRAHPRSRGENPLTGRCPASGVGSSPLTRGKPADRALSGKWSGLIPAHAGKTLVRDPDEDATTAHPRSRGENGGHFGGGQVPAGSSPLTRGKPVLLAAWCQTRRLIPAHAGKTSLRGTRVVGRAAHPRSRGENK